VQGFGTGLFTDPNGDGVNGSLDEQRARLLHDQDLLKVGLSGNLADYRFVASHGTAVSGSQVQFNGWQAGYNATPGEAVTYVDAHDNEILYDALVFKLPSGTSMVDRVRMHVLALSFVVFGQGLGFVAAGSERLRSKSLDRNSYNSGDWFNAIRWDPAQGNGFGIGLPPAADNQDKWGYAGRLLADRSLVPDAAAVEMATARYVEMLRIRTASALFGLATLAEVQAALTFPLSGPGETPGVITMRLTGGGKDLVVVFNAVTAPVTQSVPGASGYVLHPVLAGSVDPVLRTASFADGVFTVPARSVAVFTRLP
jgi:pullulanase/glycogen debranching enzyme